MRIQIDLLEKELEHEQRMIDSGYARYQKSIVDFAEGRSTTLSTVSRAIDLGIATSSVALDEWKKGCAQIKPGFKPDVYEFIDTLPSDVCVYITLQTLFNQSARGNGANYTSACVQVGAMILREINYRRFGKQYIGMYKTILRDMKERNVTSYRFVQRRFDHAMSTVGYEKVNVSPPQRCRIGDLLIRIILDNTGYFERTIRTVRKNKRVAEIRVAQELLDYIDNRSEACVGLQPALSALIVPPRDWTSVRDGGFWLPTLRQHIVQGRSIEAQKLTAKADMTQVFEAVNTMQRTAWTVDKDILTVAKHFVGSGEAGFTDSIPPVYPPKPDTEDRKELMAWRKQMIGLRYAEVRKNAKRLSDDITLHAAEELAEHDEIYFCYQLDFRGRAYPVAPNVSPQGNDLSKALLRFKRGKPLVIGGEADVDSLSWLAVHVANCAGHDKLPYSKRIEWVEDNTDMIARVANAPVEHSDEWQGLDKPMQFIAAAIEYTKALTAIESGETMYTHLPVNVDGSCNGLQHIAALLKDASGRVVNLVDNDAPADIYADVAEAVRKRLEAMPVSPHKMWLNHIDRSLVKRPVMTLPYGATRAGMADQMRDVLLSRADKGEDIPSKLLEAKECMWFAKVVWDSISDCLPSAIKFMDYMTDLAAKSFDRGLPVTWSSPVGFPVRNVYYKPNMKHIRTVVYGDKSTRMTLSDGETDKMMKRKQMSAIVPNFIHSLDAAHMLITVNECARNDIVDLAMVHDSYATHCTNIGELQYILRKVFVELYKDNFILDSLRDMLYDGDVGCGDVMVNTLDINEVLTSNYFFS